MPGIVQTAQIDSETGQPQEQGSTSGYAHVLPPDQLFGVGTAAEISGQTTTPTQTDFADGLLQLNIAFIARGMAVATVLYVVFDALNDADASTKLGASGSRMVVPINSSRSWSFSSDSPVYRVDVASDASTESGTTLVAMDGKVVA